MDLYCVVPGCSATPTKNPELSFHRYPKKGLCQIRKRSNNHKVVDKYQFWNNVLRLKDEHITKNTVICSRHFVKSDFTATGLRLLNYVAPNRNLPTYEDAQLAEELANECGEQDAEQIDSIKEELQGEVSPNPFRLNPNLFNDEREAFFSSIDAQIRMLPEKCAVDLIKDIQQELRRFKRDCEVESGFTEYSRPIMATDPESNGVIENLLKKSFGSRSYSERENIVKSERPIPKLNITTSTKKFVRHFHNKVYDDIKWLCGCIKMQKLFCWPCLLFSKEINVWNKNGFDDLNNLSKARKRHENSKCHIDSVVKLKQFGNKNRKKFNISGPCTINIESYNKTVTANRYIISKLIDVICFLSKQEFAFKGHRESIEPNNRGNYIEHLYLLSTSDNQLKIHLEKSTVFTGLSNSIENDLVKSVGNVLLQEIKQELENAAFVAIIIDETTDISHRAQISTVFRYMKENGNIEERLVAFTDVSENRDADLIFTHIKCYLDEFRCSKKLVAQTYDGAAVMVGQHLGVQAKIKEISKHAIFVHCYAHRVNLIFSQSVGCIKECKIFFQTITGISSFFSTSSKRSHALDQEVKKRFPSAIPIKWDYNSRIVNCVMEYKKELKLLLFNMVESPEKWDSDTTIAARGLYHCLTDFDFHFLLLVFQQIFAQSDIVFDMFHKKNFNVAYCMTRINQFNVFLQQKRNDFDSIWDALREDFSEIQPKKRIRLGSEIGSKKDSYRHMFCEIMDTLIKNCTERFADIKSLGFLSLLDVGNFKDYEKQFPEASFNSLTKFYGEFFDLYKLRSELQYLYSCPDYTGKSLSDIKNIIIKNDLNQDVLKELYNLISLVVTIPFSNASVECSFSTLERIHTFAGNAQAEVGLSSLALLSINKDLLNNLMESTTSDFYDKVISDFAEKNSQIELLYKK